MVKSVCGISFCQNREYVHAVSLHFLNLLDVFVQKAHGVAQASVITELVSGNEDGAKLQATAQFNHTFHVKVLVVAVEGQIFFV